MKCNYPNCSDPALWTPVIELPTLRSVGDSQAMVQTSRPTTLICREVCERHKQSYLLSDWIKAGDWDAMQNLAHEKGLHIPSIYLMAIQFKPIGWTPKRTLELVRD